MKKILVAYFSASGTTKALAKTISEVAQADLFEIQPVQPYSKKDLDWMDSSSRSTKEMKDPNCRPAITSKVDQMQSYDVLFVGFPIWWYEAPRIIQSFLESYELAGKVVIPFATSGGSGMGKTTEILQESCPNAVVREGRCINYRQDKNQLKQWFESLKL